MDKKKLKEGKEDILLMEFLVELHGHSADEFVYNHMNNLHKYNQSLYNFYLERAVQWKKDGKPKSFTAIEKSVEGKSKWLIIENENE